ncbi:MAG: hypothetical protein AABY64_03035 [Bdellovibrionota bacterium]
MFKLLVAATMTFAIPVIVKAQAELNGTCVLPIIVSSSGGQSQGQGAVGIKVDFSNRFAPRVYCSIGFGKAPASYYDPSTGNFYCHYEYTNNTMNTETRSSRWAGGKLDIINKVGVIISYGFKSVTTTSSGGWYERREDLAPYQRPVFTLK